MFKESDSNKKLTKYSYTMLKNNSKCSKVKSFKSKKEIQLFYKKLKTLKILLINSHLKSWKLMKKSKKLKKGSSFNT